MSAKRILLIANPASGRHRGEQCLAVARAQLKALGHAIQIEAPDNAFGFGGAQLVQRNAAGGYAAGSDPRKDGQAAGF